MALTDQLSSYYKLDGNSNDAVGSVNGTDTSVTYSAGNGKIVQGAGFNGSSSKIVLPSIFNFNTGDFTINAWAKPTSINRINWIFTSGASIGLDNQLQFGYGSDNSFIFAFYSDDLNSGTTYAADLNTYVMWTATYVHSTKTQTIYRNGVQVATRTAGGNPLVSTSSYIGIRNGFEKYAGNIDELGIWSRAISTSEMASLYNGGSGLAYPLTVASASTNPGFFALAA